MSDQPTDREVCGASRPDAATVCVLLSGHSGRHTSDGLEWWRQEGDKAAYERGMAEERARQFDHDKLAAVICATRDDAVHQILAEDYVCGDCEEIAREVQQHFAAGGSDAH